MISFVIDASVAAACLFDDELHAGANALMAGLYDGVVFVPQHWHLEVRNALLVDERRGRITSEQTSRSLTYLSELPLLTDSEPDLNAALDLARSHGLSFYDAIYLELAHRRQVELATLDGRLKQAASAEGLGILP